MQTICFAILFAIWVLPGTIALRNACLGIGALLSLYPIYTSRLLFLQKRAVPIWLIGALFGWVAFHFLFLSQDPVSQLAELNSIWKRAAIGVIFAIGMGISIAELTNKTQYKCQSKYCNNLCWIIFYGGLLAPTLLYSVKFLLTSYASGLGISIPTWMQIYLGPNAVYIAKTAYVAFCMPVFAVALGALLQNIAIHRWFCWGNFIYLMTLLAVFLVFYVQNIKNGVAYSFLLLAGFLILLFLSTFHGRCLQKSLLIFVLSAASLIFLSKHLEQNASWSTLASDAKIALNTSQNAQWKYNGEKGYPNNEMGIPVSQFNYERVAWAKEGLRLIAENPLGYGLVERSFGHLAKLKWPDSKLHQSHSGWIDLVLGIGIPGAALLLTSFLVLFKQLAFAKYQIEISIWVISCRWSLFCLLLIWCTTEISQKVYIESLLFWIALSGGINLGLAKSEITSRAFSKNLLC